MRGKSINRCSRIARSQSQVGAAQVEYFVLIGVFAFTLLGSVELLGLNTRQGFCDLAAYPDFNGDGVMDGGDLDLWNIYYPSSDPAADLNCDGEVNNDDRSIFGEWMGTGGN